MKHPEAVCFLYFCTGKCNKKFWQIAPPRLQSQIFGISKVAGCNFTIKIILHGPQTASVASCRSLWMMQIDTWPWSHAWWTHISHMVLKYANESYFTFSGYLTNWPHMTFDFYLWPLTSWLCEGSYVMSINHVWFQSDFNFSNEVNFTFWAHLTTWPDGLWTWYMTFDHKNIQRVPYCINTPSLVPIGLKLFKRGHFYNFSLSYNLTSDELWYWYVDLWPHQQMRVLMLHLWPNFGWNPSKHVDSRAKC